MKTNLKKTLLFVFGISLFSLITISCSKSDDAIIEPKQYNYRLLSDGFRSYEYNNDGKLTKCYKTNNVNDITTFTYNSQGKLVNVEDRSNLTGFFFEISDYVYDNQGKVITKIINSKNSSNSNIIKGKYEYIYNANGQIIRANYFAWDAATSQFSPSVYYSLYSYNASGNLIKFENKPSSSYNEFVFDANNNVIEQN